jgi:putative inorganic carbon (HCO3(-)) transporter
MTGVAFRNRWIRIPLTRAGWIGDRALPAAAVAASAAAGALVVFSHQLAVALVLLAAVVAAYLQSRRAGLVGVWVLWLMIPFLRRVFGLLEGTPQFDVLAVVPFAATGIVAVLEADRLYLSRRAKTLVGLAAIGFAFGVPAGLLSPTAGLFATGAYLSALAAFALGYSERRHGSDELALGTALRIALPLIAVYGLFQYFFPLTAWDRNWLDTVTFGSIGAPEANHIRIFATLNAPATLAALLAFGILTVISIDKGGALRPLLVALFTLALALTFVRSAWLALVVAIIVYAAAAGVRRPARVVAIVAILVAASIAVSGGNSTAAAFVSRLTTLGGLGQDQSANARIRTANDVLPQVFAHPFGEGLGRVGVASRLGGAEPGATNLDLDNGYLALGLQVGLIGSLLIIAAAAWAISLAARAARLARGSPVASLCLSILLFGVVMNLSGDALYGVVGAVFWYVAGFATAMADDRETELRSGYA